MIKLDMEYQLVLACGECGDFRVLFVVAAWADM